VVEAAVLGGAVLPEADSEVVAAEAGKKACCCNECCRKNTSNFA